MSAFWHWWVIGLTAITLVGCYWLIKFAARIPAGHAETETDVTGHSWDGLQELNNPLPRWWMWMFYLTIVFGIIYFALYPGLGNFQGFLGWSQTGQYDREVRKADKEYGPIFAAFAAQDIDSLSKDPKAKEAGNRLYLTYCAVCHGSDARGATGFPNLADEDWLYGGDPDAIKASILDGRQGFMPPFGGALGDDGVKNVVQYVKSLSGMPHDAAAAQQGQTQYMTLCAGCHMPNGVGMAALGAPNLTDNAWLYGRSDGAIAKTIREGRKGVMPAHRAFLGEDKSHLLAAYIYGLSK